MARVKPPRAAFLNFPLGRPCGRPNDPDLQKSILKSALDLLKKASVPGVLVDLPYAWGAPFDWKGFAHDLEEMLREEGSEMQSWAPTTQ